MLHYRRPASSIFFSGAFALPRDDTPAKWNILSFFSPLRPFFLRAARSELEHRRDAVIARKPPELLSFFSLAFGSRINLRYRGVALDPRVRQFSLLFTLDRLISAETTKRLRAHRKKVILNVMIRCQRVCVHVKTSKKLLRILTNYLCVYNSIISSKSHHSREHNWSTLTTNVHFFSRC